MPNNFKLRGDYYVSKAGSDSNSGTSPDSPKRTIQAALTAAASGQTIIIATGIYAETLSKTTSGQIFRADGYVVLDASLISNKTISLVGADFRFYGFEIRNYTSFSCGTVGYTSTIINACIFKNTTTSFIGNGITSKTFTNNLFINCDLTNADAHILDSCILINCKLGVSTSTPNPYTLRNTYMNQGSICVMSNSATNNYNNIQGLIIVPAATSITTGIYQDVYGRYYDLSITTSTGDGTIGNPYGRPYTNGAAFNFTIHRILYPTINANSFSSDPGFNNILKQDFSLQSSSFMVGRASNFIDNIGGTSVATRLDASGSSFSGSNATVDTLVFAPFSDYVISGSAVTGSVTSAPIFVSSSAKVIQEIDYNGLLAFNKDTTAPTGSNVNVPDVLTYTSASGQPGANPDRLTYYMRWTTGSSQPVSDGQWENGGLWPAGSFNVFEWNTKPSVDFLGRGNGDQNFSIANTPTYVKATWIQLRVTLRNDYLI